MRRRSDSKEERELCVGSSQKRLQVLENNEANRGTKCAPMPTEKKARARTLLILKMVSAVGIEPTTY